MRGTDAVLWLALVVASGGLLPITFVVFREARRRKAKVLALARLQEAERAIEAVEAGEIRDPSALGAAADSALRGFDRDTIERTVERLLEDALPARRLLATELAVRLSVVDRYVDRARTAPTWSERAHAVRILGLLMTPKAVPVLAAVLRDRYEEGAVRSVAADALANLRDPEAVEPLAKELASGDEGASPSIAEALVRFGTQATPVLVRLLDEQGQPVARVWAARILGRIADASAVEPLILRLRDRHEALRTAAAESLGHLGDRHAIVPLTQAMLRDPLPQVRAHAAGSLAQIAGEQAASVLVAALSDPDFATRLRAIEAFENMHLTDTSALERALGDPNAEVRRRAAIALERTGYLEKLVEELAADQREKVEAAYSGILQLGEAGLVEGIAGFLRHESLQVRALVAKAAGELGIARMGPMLLAGLDDPAWPVRASLCDALRRLRPSGSMTALVRLLADPEEAVREAAAEAMAAFSNEEASAFEAEIGLAYQNGSVPIRLSMVEIAARIDSSSMMQIVIEASRDPSEAVRLRAVKALGSRPAESAVPALVLSLTDSSFQVRLAAVPALGAAGTADACEALLRALPGAPPELRERVAQALSGIGRQHLLRNAEELARSDDVDIRLGVAWTLGKIGDAVGLPILAGFLRDKDARLRASAAGALGKIRGPETVAILLETMEDRDPKTRAAVVNAIAKMGEAGPQVQDALEQRLADPDLFVRNRAGIALARVARKRALALCTAPKTAHLIDDAALAIMRGLVGTEETIALALGTLADPARRARVNSFLERDDPLIRAEFFSGLRLSEAGEGTGEAVLEPLALAAQYERLLRTSQNVLERTAAVEALAHLPIATNIAAFAEALSSDPSEAVRLRCAQVLGEQVDDPAARSALVGALADPNDRVALAVLKGLAGRQEVDIAAALHERLLAGSDEVNAAVEQALAAAYRDDPTALLDRIMGASSSQALVTGLRVLERLGTPAALPLLAELLKSGDPCVRVGAIRALATVSEPESQTLIGSMLEDPNESVRLAVIEAMATEGASGLVRLAAARLDPSVLVRQRLSELLAKSSGAATSKVLESLLLDAAPSVRASAAVTLLALCDPESLRRFVSVWRRASPDVRRAACADARAEAIAEKLGACVLASADTSLREAAVVGLGALAVPGFEDQLVPVLGDPKPSVRVAAARALVSSRSPEIRDRIGKLLEDPDLSVREAVRDAFRNSVG